MNLAPSWEQQREREAAFDKVVLPVREAMAVEISSEFGVGNVWSGHFGATGIDPKNLFAYFVVPTRDDVRRIRTSPWWAVHRQAFLERLTAAGYPTIVVSRETPGLFSEQECKEEADGNWYHFFK